MMRKIFIMSLLCLPMFVWGQSQAKSDTLELSVAQVIEKLKADNMHIQASEYQLSKAEKERKAKKGLYYPKFDLSATFTQMSEPLELDMTPVRDAILPAYDLIGSQTDAMQSMADYLANTNNMDDQTYIAFSQNFTSMSAATDNATTAINEGEWVKTIQEEQFAAVDASMTWPLFTGGKIRAANKAAKARLEEKRAKNQKVVSQEITSVMERYFGLQLAMNVQKVRQQVVNGMEKHLRDAKKLEENGMIAHAERLHAEVALVEAKREMNKAKNRVELMQTAIQNSLATNQPVKPTTDLFITANKDNLNDFVKNAQNMNPAIRELEAKEKLAQQAVKKEKSAWYPNVFAFGQANLVNYQLSEYMPDWMVGVGLKLNLFDGLQKLRKTQAAQMQRMEVQAWRNKAKQDIATGVTKIYQQMEQAADNYESAQTSIKFAKEYLRIRKKAFNEGFATSTDVVDARLNLAKVETEKLKAMFDFDTALVKLLELGFKSEEITDYAKQTQSE